MLRNTLGLKAILPAILAIFIIAISPLLQLIHISSCSCEHSHYKSLYNIYIIQQDIGVIDSCLKSHSDSKSNHTGHGHQHDSKNCPICQMYAAIHAGFVVPINSIAIVPKVISEQSVVFYSSIFSAGTSRVYLPRAPPAI